MQNGRCFWITGLSGAGKSTIGRKVYEAIKNKKKETVLLDGDELRSLFSNYEYSMEARKALSYKYSELCEMLTKQGINVVICTIAMFEEVRKNNRRVMENYTEIYIKVPMAELVRRNQKDLYNMAINKEIDNVVGVDANFEEPENPDIVIENDGKESVDKITRELMHTLQKMEVV